MEILKIARIPPVLASPEMTVYEAVSRMAAQQVGAVVVTDPGRRILGIFTERDNLLRVTLKRLDLDHTILAKVMTSPVLTAPPETSVTDALARMVRNRFRHLPIVDVENRPIGIVSVRYLLMRRLSEEQANLETISAYVTAGGPG